MLNIAGGLKQIIIFHIKIKQDYTTLYKRPVLLFVNRKSQAGFLFGNYAQERTILQFSRPPDNISSIHTFKDVTGALSYYYSF